LLLKLNLKIKERILKDLMLTPEKER